MFKVEVPLRDSNIPRIVSVPPFFIARILLSYQFHQFLVLNNDSNTLLQTYLHGIHKVFGTEIQGQSSIFYQEFMV